MAIDDHDATRANPADTPAGADEEHEADEAGGRLRPAMLDDGQPSFPLWLPLPGILVAIVWAGYQGVTAEIDGAATALETLLWPGAGIWIGTTIAAYLGWRLDLD